MKCTRCGNLILHTADEDYCYACGHRPIPQEPIPLCKGWYVRTRCSKTPINGSDYCLEHDRQEIRKRKQLVKDLNLGELE